MKEMANKIKIDKFTSSRIKSNEQAIKIRDTCAVKISIVLENPARLNNVPVLMVCHFKEE